MYKMTGNRYVVGAISLLIIVTLACNRTAATVTPNPEPEPPAIETSTTVLATELTEIDLPNFYFSDASQPAPISAQEPIELDPFTVEQEMLADQEIMDLVNAVFADQGLAYEDLGTPIEAGRAVLSNGMEIEGVAYDLWGDPVGVMRIGDTPFVFAVDVDVEPAEIFLITRDGIVGISEEGLYFEERTPQASKEAPGLSFLMANTCTTGRFYDLKKCVREAVGAPAGYVTATCAAALAVIVQAWWTKVGLFAGVVVAIPACGYPVLACVPYIMDNPPVVSQPRVQAPVAGYYSYCPNTSGDSTYITRWPMARVQIDVDDDALPMPPDVYEKIPMIGHGKSYVFTDCSGQSTRVFAEIPRAEPEKQHCEEGKVCFALGPGEAICQASTGKHAEPVKPAEPQVKPGGKEAVTRYRGTFDRSIPGEMCYYGETIADEIDLTWYDDDTLSGEGQYKLNCPKNAWQNESFQYYRFIFDASTKFFDYEWSGGTVQIHYDGEWQTPRPWTAYKEKDGSLSLIIDRDPITYVIWAGGTLFPQMP